MSERLRQAPCWLSVVETARYLHCRAEYVREAVASGRLRAYRRDAASNYGTLIHTDDIDAFVRETYAPAMCEAAARRMRAGA